MSLPMVGSTAYLEGIYDRGRREDMYFFFNVNSLPAPGHHPPCCLLKSELLMIICISRMFFIFIVAFYLTQEDI